MSADTRSLTGPDEAPAKATALRMLPGVQLRRLLEAAAVSILRFRERDLPDVVNIERVAQET